MKLFTVFFTCLIFGLQAEFFFTQQMIESHLERYNKEEIQLIDKDLEVVRGVCFDNIVHSERPFYLATAGSPGARKTTILEKFVSTHPEYQGGVYLDPDPRTLKFMVHTYHQSLTPLAILQGKNYDQVIKNAYHKWRGGSNYIVLNLFEEAMEKGHSIIYGTTSTGAHTPNFLAKLKTEGYKIVLLLCSCPDTLRKEAVEYRNQEVRFYQSSPEDALAKGKFFPQRMQAYFDYADELFFYWSDDLFTPERLGATWKKDQFIIYDHEAFELFAEKYEADRLSLSSEGHFIPSFDSYFSKSNVKGQ